MYIPKRSQRSASNEREASLNDALLDRHVVEREILRPLGIFGVPFNDYKRYKLWLPRLPKQWHLRLLRRTITLAAIAWRAASDEIFPCRFSTRASRRNVIDRCLARVYLLGAVAALVVIAKKDVLFRERDLLPPVLDVIQHADDAWQRKRDGR